MNRIEKYSQEFDDGRTIFEVMEQDCPSEMVASFNNKHYHACKYVNPTSFNCLECWTKEVE